MPIRLGVMLVAAGLPGDDFVDQYLLVGDTSIETLARQGAEFRSSHVQPTSVFGRVVPLEPLDELADLRGGKSIVA